MGGIYCMQVGKVRYIQNITWRTGRSRDLGDKQSIAIVPSLGALAGCLEVGRVLNSD